MPTKLITETKDWIDSHLTPAKTLTLTSELFGDIISDSFETVFSDPSIEIDEVSFLVVEAAVTISGKTAFGAGAFSITVEIKDVDDKYVVSVLFPEIQTPADIASGLSAIWERFDLPEFFTGFQIAGIEFPSIEQSFSIIAEQNDPLGLADDKIVIGPSARIKFQITYLTSASIEFLAAFSAPISIGSFKFRLTGELSTDDAVDSKLTIEPIAPADYPSFGDLVEMFLGAGVQIPDGLTIADLQLGDFFQKDAFTLSLRFNETWTLALGPAGLTVRDISTTVVWAEDNLTGVLRGTVTIAGFDVEINSNLLEQLTLSGKLPTVKITSLIESIAGPVFSLPSGFPEIELPEADFSIPTLADSLSFLLRTAAGDYGTVWLLITKIDDEWQAAVVFVLADGWKFSQLSALLAPLNQLPISRPMLTLASFSEPEFSFPEIDGATLQLALHEGVALNSDLILKGLGLDFVRLLIDQERLPLLLTVGDSLTETEVRVKIVGSKPILPGVIVFEQFALEIDPDPFAIALAATAEVTIFRQELPKFSASTVLKEDGKPEIKFNTLESWKNPLGISGLTIIEVVLQIKTSPPPQYSILGKIAVSDKYIEAAGRITGSALSMIYGKLEGEFTLQEVVRDLVGLSLPIDILDISISNFKLRAVADPMGVTIDGETFESGLALQGTIGFFGLKGFTKVVVEPDRGVYAHAALSEIINLGDVLVISNATGDGPASFTLDTRDTLLLQVSGRYEVLGILGEGLDVSIDDDGMAFQLDGQIGRAQHILSCHIKSFDNFSTTGTISFGIKEAVGPLEITPGVSLGKIKLETGFTGETSLSLINDQFKASISGGFEFQGISPEIQIKLSVAPDSLEEFPQLIEDEIINNAKEIFADLLQDADKWLLAIRDGIIEGVEDIAGILKNEFNRSSEQIGRDIANTLDRGSAAAAQALKSIGETAQHIAPIIKNLTGTSADVRSALIAAEFPVTEINAAMQKAFPEIPHTNIGATLHVNVGAKQHVNTPAIPAVNIAAVPRVNIAAVPRVNIAAVPRVNTYLIPHVDRRIHVNIGPNWAHTDRSRHVNTGPSNHVNTPAKAHVNTPAKAHVNTPAQAHINTPAQAHINTPAVAHANVPAKAHIDTP